MTQTIDQTLADRGARYGEFVDHAEVTQAIKGAFALGRNWNFLSDDQKECLEMIAHKVGRILNGDPSYIDSWTDIIGYTRLVEKRLIEEQADESPSTEETQSGGRPQSNRVESVFETLAKMKAEFESRDAMSQEEGSEPKCDNPACTNCHPEISAALKTLLDAGVISQVD